jgi:hypothetical protein
MVSVIEKKGSPQFGRRFHDRSSGKAIARAAVSMAAQGPISPKERAALISAYKVSSNISLHAMGSGVSGAKSVR